MKNNKQKQKYFYIGLLIFALFSIIFLFIQNSPSQIVNPNSQIITTPSILQNDIKSNINGFTFNIQSHSNPTNLPIYNVNLLNLNIVKKMADSLNLTTMSSQNDYYQYTDTNNNLISYNGSDNTFDLENINIKKLSGYTEQNFLSNFSQISGIDFSNYVKVQSTITTDKLSTILTFKPVINSYDVILDFDYPTSLIAYINNNGVLTHINLHYVGIVNQSTKPSNLLSIQFIQQNFTKLEKGIYPDFPYLKDGTESLPQTQDFKGNIEITDYKIEYLWSINNKNIITPIFKLSTKFHFDTGLSTAGSIVINAVDTSK